MEKNQEEKNDVLKLEVKELIKQDKKLNLIKPLSDAFDKTNCEKEVHQGNKNFFRK